MSASAGYSGTPLAAKLGIKTGMRVALVDAPANFRRTLAPLPAEVRIVDKMGAAELAIWFVTSARGLDTRMAAVAGAMGSALWIAWPKKASGVTTDVSEDVVRRAGLASGLVDYKVCAIDATWSGLKFARRRTPSRMPHAGRRT